MKKTTICCFIIAVLISLFFVPTFSGSSSVSAQGSWWDRFGEPKYGGTITFHTGMLQLTFDPWAQWTYCWHNQDMLFCHDWTLDRKVWDFQTNFVPETYWKPLLAESWEWKDPKTLEIKIRKGVHWHNKPPANGREFIAEDVQFHYDRAMGTGSGFTEPNPNYMMFAGAIEKVTATDRYTLVFKFKQPSAFGNSQATFEPFIMGFELPELVKSGKLNDWKNSVGTGPFMLSDYAQDTAVIFDRNPDYWGVDQRHPKNRVPYVDQVKMICIPDPTTAIAAMRTGKVDWMDNVTLPQSQNLAKTNPDLNQEQVSLANLSLFMRCDKKPFTDINVRKALNFAIDRKTLAETFYGGLVDGLPSGMICPNYTGWCYPYDEWPQELKDEHTFNPEKAKKLLAEAGYPNGFKTNAVGNNGADTQLMQIIKSYFMDVGVDLEIRLMDFVAVNEFTRAGKHDQTCFALSNNPHIPSISIGALQSGNPINFSHVNDPTYEEMAKKFQSAVSIDDAKRISRELDEYYLKQHWKVDIFPTFKFVSWQPPLKGYSGEQLNLTNNFYWARFWKDPGAKK